MFHSVLRLVFCGLAGAILTSVFVAIGLAFFSLPGVLAVLWANLVKQIAFLFKVAIQELIFCPP